MDDRVESLLRASRPEPDAQFVEKLESRLLGTPIRVSRRRLPRWTLPLRPTLAAVGALGAVILALGLTGAGPFSGHQDGARAHENCRWVTVQRPGKVPTVVATAKGDPQIVYRDGLVSQRIKRCS